MLEAHNDPRRFVYAVRGEKNSGGGAIRRRTVTAAIILVWLYSMGGGVAGLLYLGFC